MRDKHLHCQLMWDGTILGLASKMQHAAAAHMHFYVIAEICCGEQMCD
jgi:hypothetical protein